MAPGILVKMYPQMVKLEVIENNHNIFNIHHPVNLDFEFRREQWDVSSRMQNHTLMFLPLFFISKVT